MYLFFYKTPKVQKEPELMRVLLFICNAFAVLLD